jgi:hypothetical protein
VNHLDQMTVTHRPRRVIPNPGPVRRGGLIKTREEGIDGRS